MTYRYRAAVRLLAAAAMLGWHWLPGGWAMGSVARLRWALGCDEIENLDRLLSRVNGDHTDQGYYNQLLDSGPDQPLAIAEAVPELRQIVLRPNLSVVRNDGTRWTTNAMGMRDRPYAVHRPPGTLRIAMTGDSIGVGLGVGDGRGFEPIVETRLNEESRRRGGPAVEILNLALPGRSAAQRWDHFRKAGWATEPDVVLFEATPADINWDRRRLSELLPQGIGWDSPLFGDILSRPGIRRGLTTDEFWEALAPYRWDLLAAVYRSIADDCRARGVPCIWVLIPRVGRFVDAMNHRRLLDVARSAGFTAVVDISDAFDGRDPGELAVHPSDFHPNPEGHALIAERLSAALQSAPALDVLRPPIRPGSRRGPDAVGRPDSG